MDVDLDDFGQQDIERFVTGISELQAADRSALAYRAVLRSLSYLLLEYDLGRAEQRLNMMSRRELKERANAIFRLLPCILCWPDVVLRDSWKQSVVSLTERGTLVFDARIPSFVVNMRVSDKPKFLEMFYNKHGVPFVGFGFELFGRTGTQALLSDLMLDTELLDKVTASELLEFPLFNGDHARAVPSDLLGMLSARSGWEFWDRWYRGFLKGEPLDWELQRRVALIPQEVWEAGADAVAEAIAEIEARYEVQKAAADLIADRDSAVVQNRLGIGGNSPPEPIEVSAEVVTSQTIIWAAVEEISEEAESETPDKARLARALEALKKGTGVCLKWVGRKVDLAVDTAVKEGLTQAIKTGGYLYGVKLLIDAMEKWLPLLP
ncbi:hypothetical protein [Antarctobacter jejuensis]|uniref:hypothetical protein n=1 Tax=Antarctobacter jejuensis TaxID=1439938 RepID=UPI003FD023CC